MSCRAISSALLVGGQCLAAVAALAALRMQPPAVGEMVLVPLTPHSQSELVDLALAHDLRIVAKGDWPGSVIVRGARDRLGWALRDEGVLVLATDPVGCAAT